MFEGKKILVTGGTGLIGTPLTEELLRRGAKVRVVSLDDPSRANPAAEFLRLDLCEFGNCLRACEGIDYAFHLAGIKGSPAMTATRPASFFYPTISFNTNMLEAARRSGVRKYLFTSTVGVYEPADIFYEDSVWNTFPSPNDRFAGWAKRMGELQLEAYRIEYGWEDLYIVRPANVYGARDNFDPANAMVIPSLIRRALDGENPLRVWGDGETIRDFIHARDVATGMLRVFELGVKEPVNLGSGRGVRIREIVEIIRGHMKDPPEVIWDTSKPAGDRVRILSSERAEKYGIRPQVSLKEGIRETMDWFRAHRAEADARYNVFRP